MQPFLWTSNFQGSALVKGSRRTVVGLALAVAFFLSGHGFARFDKTLRQYLGISCLSKNPYYEVVKLIYPRHTGQNVSRREGANESKGT